MSIRIFSGSELLPSSSDREGGFRGLDERFIALPVRQRSRREGQSKSLCPCLARSGLLIDLPSLRPFLSCPASRSPRASAGDRNRIHCRAGPGEFPCCRTRAAPRTRWPARDGGHWSTPPARCEEDSFPIPAAVSVVCLAS